MSIIKGFTQLHRMIYINWVLAKHGLDEIILATPWFLPFRFLGWINPWNWFRDRQKSEGVRIRQALEELGPIFIKLGQMLSTRPDLIPEDIATELAFLQDNVPPFANAKALVEQLYGCPVEQLFLSFDEEPLASASVAQVHAATLLNGKSVVVKVLRPNIEKIIRRDLALMHLIAALMERYWRFGRFLRPKAVISEFEHTILNELDLMREAANGTQLRRNFQHSPLLFVPEIFWAYTQKRVLVMERIVGVPISNVAVLSQHGINLKKLAERGVEIFFTQVFRDCFFHADMHPGNIFVDVTRPHDPRYMAVDFGVVGTLDSFDQRYLAENMLAFFKRDYRRVAELHLASGWVGPQTRVDEFEAAIRTVCEPIFERPLKDISCGQLLLRLFQAGKQFNMKIQPQLLLLQKTLIHVEGLGRQLYPELDLWSTAKPFLERWLKEQLGGKALLRKIRDNLPYWGEKLPELPDLLYRALQQCAQVDPVASRLSVQPVEPSSHRRGGFFLGMAFLFLLGGFLCLLLEKQWIALPLTLSAGSVVLLGSGLLFLLMGLGLRSE